MSADMAAERGEVAPLWISIGLVVGLFTVVLTAWRLEPVIGPCPPPNL